MAKYIDAEAAKRVIRDLSLHGTVTATPQQLEAAIDEIPAADVEPVRHGRWIFGETIGHSWMKCSECLVSQSGHTLCFSYCPNCGAKMDGEVTE